MREAEELFWNAFLDDLLIGINHLTRQFDVEIETTEEERLVALYRYAKDGLKRSAEIKLHQNFCLVSVSAVISRSRDEYYTTQSGEIVRVFDADVSVFEIARAAEIALHTAFTWDAEQLKHIKPPWHNKNRRS